MFSVNDLALIIHQHQIRNANLAVMHAERIHPEMIGKLRIARGDVAGDALIKSKFREKPERSRQTFFAMPALVGNTGELRRPRKICPANGLSSQSTPPSTAGVPAGILRPPEKITARITRGRKSKILLSSHHPRTF